MHSRRLLTAAVGIPAILFLAYRGEWPWSAGVLVLHLVAVFEVAAIIRALGMRVPAVVLYTAGVFFEVGSYLWGSNGYLIAGLAVFALLVVYFLGMYPRYAVVDLAVGLWVSVYLSLFSFLVLLREACTWQHIFAVLFVTWANDTAAYYAGSLWGRHYLAPAISPNKTWEGTLGGLLAAALVGVAAGFLLGGWWVDWLALALLVAVAGQTGDLFESALKRQAQLKDSGGLLPGHGGVLDRFDSLLFVAPLVLLVFRWFGIGN